MALPIRGRTARIVGGLRAGIVLLLVTEPCPELGEAG